MKFNLQKIDYAVIPKYHLKDKRLSLKAKGLLSIMFTLPEEWDYNIKGLCAVANCGETQIKGILQELKLSGYLEVKKERDYMGRYEYIYYIYYKPKRTKNQELAFGKVV